MNSLSDPTTPCDEHDCPIGFRCQLDSNWQPFCECEVRCDATTMFGPVCAKNGITYPHLCDLKKDECKKLTFIPVDFFGDCNAPTGTYLLLVLLYNSVSAK